MTIKNTFEGQHLRHTLPDLSRTVELGSGRLETNQPLLELRSVVQEPVDIMVSSE